MSLQNFDGYVKRAAMHECQFFTGNPRKKGLMNYEKLCYYDAETSTRHIDEVFEPCESWTSEQYNVEYDNYIARHSLSIENLVQICVLIPASLKKAKKAASISRASELVTLNNQKFYRCFLGHLIHDATTEQHHIHARKVAAQFKKFRDVLGKSAVFAGFNNEKFDSGILGRLNSGANTSKSLTHVIKMHDLREIDLRRWTIAIGWQSLEKVGRGLEKLGYKDTLKLDGMTSTDQNALDRYNARDVDILANMTHFFNKLGITHHNMPTYVKNYYSLAFAAHGIESVKSDAAWGDYEGIGARCEAYEFVLDNSHIYDMNSLYPSVMSLLDYPRFEQEHENGFARVKLRRMLLSSHNAKLLPHQINELHDDEAGQEIITSPKFLAAYKRIFGNVFYWLRVKISAIDPAFIECFPFGYKDDAGAVRFTHVPDQVYEVDSYNVTFLAHCVYEIIDIRYTRTSELIFKKTIDELYRQRKLYQKDGNPLQMLNKIILNSGFGIWGSRGDKTARYYDHKIAARYKQATDRVLNFNGKRVKNVVMYDNRTQALSLFRKIGDKLYATDADNNRFTKTSIPAISQTTLSHARALMFSIMRKIINDGGRILYTDTDSLFIDDRGREIIEENGLVGGDLGQIKHEASIEKGYAIGPKMYAYTDSDGNHISKAKGVQKMHKQSTTYATNHTDTLKMARRTVAKAGGSTKRRLDSNTLKHVNEYGTRDVEWGKLLMTMLKFTASEQGEEVDHNVIKEFVEMER